MELVPQSTTRERKCTRKATETRRWAAQDIQFCSKHAELWDDTVTKALTGNWN